MQILVPPYFWLVTPHFVCSGYGTAVSGEKSSFMYYSNIVFLRWINKILEILDFDGNISSRTQQTTHLPHKNLWLVGLGGSAEWL